MLDVYKIDEGIVDIKPHEFSQGIDILQTIWNEYGDIEDTVHVIFFLTLKFRNGLTVPLDCLIVKDNALIILEMKNWDGKIKVYTEENKIWCKINEDSGDEEEIIYHENGKISKKNPYSQIHEERVSLSKFIKVELLKKEKEDNNLNYRIMSQIKGFVVTGYNSEIIFSDKTPNIRTWFDAFPTTKVLEKIRDLSGEKNTKIAKYIMEYVKTLKYTKIRCPKGLSFEDQNICNKQSYDSPVLNLFLQKGTEEEILKAIDIIKTLELENYGEKLKIHLKARNNEIRRGIYSYFLSLPPESVNNVDHIVSGAMNEDDLNIVKNAIDYVSRYHNFSGIFKESIEELHRIASSQCHWLHIDAIDTVGLFEDKDSRQFLDKLLVQTFDFNRYKELTFTHREAVRSFYNPNKNETLNSKGDLSVIHKLEQEIRNILDVFSHILKISGRYSYGGFVSMCERILCEPKVIGYDWTESLFSKGGSDSNSILLSFEHSSAMNLAMYISSYFSDIKGHSRSQILVKFLDKSEDWGKELIIETLGEIGDYSACKAIEPYLACDDFHLNAIASLGKLKCKNQFGSILTYFNTMLNDNTRDGLKIVWNSLRNISEEDLIKYLEKRLGEHGEGSEIKEEILMLMSTDKNRILLSSQMILNLCSFLGSDFLTSFSTSLLIEAYEKGNQKEFIIKQLFQLAKNGNSKEKVAIILIITTEIFDYPEILSILESDTNSEVIEILDEVKSMLQDNKAK